MSKKKTAKEILEEAKKKSASVTSKTPLKTISVDQKLTFPTVSTVIPTGIAGGKTPLAVKGSVPKVLTTATPAKQTATVLPTVSSATLPYADAVRKYFQQGLAFAQQGPKSRQQIADELLGFNIGDYDRGDISDLSMEILSQLGQRNAYYINQHRDQGTFDEPQFLTGEYISLPSKGFLDTQYPLIGAELEKSRQKDEEAKIFESNLQSTRGAWEQLEMEKNNPYMFDPMYVYAMMEYLQGNREEPFNFDQWDYDYQNLPAAEQQERLAKLQEQWNALDFDTLTGRNYKPYQSQTPELEAQYNLIGKEIDKREAADKQSAMLRSHPSYGTPYVAPESKTFPMPSVDQNGNWTFGTYDSNMYDELYLMHSGLSYADLYTAAQNNPKVKWYLEEGLNYMLPEEVAEYKVAKEIGDEEATAWLRNNRSKFLLRRAMVMEEWTKTKAGNTWLEIPSYIDARINNLANVLNVPRQVAEAWLGIDDPNSPAFDQMNKNAWVGEEHLDIINDMEVWEPLKKAVGYVYQGTTSAVDNFARLAASGFNPTASLIIAGLQSGSASLHESADRDDMSGAAKVVKAIGTGAIEVGTEKIGLDAFFDKGQKNAVNYIKQVFLSELGEEEINALSEPVLEAVVAFLFDHEAEIKSGPEFWQDLTDTAITTAISSLLMGGGGAITQTVDNRQTGKAIQQQGDPEKVLEIAKSMPKDSDAYAMAVDIEGTVGKGKKLPLGKLGKLTQTLNSALSEEASSITNRVYEDAIADRLMELGDDSATARKNAPIVRKVASGEKLTVAERTAVAWNDHADKVAKEIIRENNYTDGEPVPIKWVSNAKRAQTDATREVMGKQIQLVVAEHTKRNVSTVVAEAVKKGEQKTHKGKDGKPAGKLNARKVYYDDGTNKGSGDILRFEESEDGKLQMVLKADTDGKGEVKVDIGNFTEADGTGTAGLIEAIKDIDENLHKVTAEEASAMLNTYNVDGGDVGRFVENYERAYLAGFSGADGSTVGVTGLDPKLAEIAYDAGKRQAEKEEADRLDRVSRARQVETPTVGWLGDVDDNSQLRGTGDIGALDEAVTGMTDGQRYVVEYAKALAEKARINVVLFNSKAGRNGKFAADNGRYDPNTHTIYLDINAGLNDSKAIKAARRKGTLGYAMMRTLGHEVTHAIESTSAEYYAKYKQAVKNALKAKGQDWAVLVRERIDEAIADGKKMTYAEAESEIVADASEYMLQDADFSKNLDTGIVNKIKTVVKNFVTKLNDIFRELGNNGTVESNAIREMQDGVYHYMDGLQELWGAAFEEMAGVEGANNGVEDTLYETGEVYSYTTQSSARVRDEKTIASLENQKHITTYRAMQLIDGELYPPMAEFIGSKKSGTREDASTIGHWEMATEHPELIKWVDGKPKFELKKTNDDGSVSTVPAAYNPYMHSSNTVLNDQFSKAFQRTNLVVVECVVPVSESDGAYHAQYAKDATGWHEWKSGIVAGDLAKQKAGFRRDVFLSRYIKPVRILPDAEVAEKIAGYLDGTDVTVPFQSAWPTLREALVQAGVNVTEPRGLGPAQMKIAMEAFEEWKRESNEADIRHSRRKTPKLTSSEYGRVQSAWVDYTERGYQFFVRHNGGIIVDLDSAIVYTDDEGMPQYVLDVGTDDRWSNNDVYNAVIEMEEEGKSHEVQRRILKSLFGTKGAHFRAGRERPGIGRENRAGTGRDAGTLGQRDYGEVSEEITDSLDGIEVDSETGSGYKTQSSARTWRGSDYVTKRDEMAQKLSQSIDVPVSTARKWLDDVNSIAAYVLDNKARVDYIPTAVKGVSAFKSNPEYGGSIDMSTICAKRRLATGTLDAIQRVLGDAVLTKDDFLHIREMMKERGYEVACGLCFVESSRKNLSKYNAQFMEQYNSTHSDGEISMTDLNTVDGLEALRLNNEVAYAEYEKFMNKLAQRKPKLFEKRTEYNHEILKKFRSDTTVDIKNLNGGMRLQSFSDFEIVHLIDMMQVITDMASVGLAGQAYTKVPDFAWALGDTGLKINLSLIAKGVDADGNLIFDDVEGMNHNDAKKLRDAYSKNVGTIVVTFTDEQLLAAMKSDMVDYIIPFHRSQWQKGDYKKLGLPEGTKDYTLHQNEKQGRKRVKENLLPNAYWDFSLSGKENAEKYLSLCAASGRTPKFAKFLVNNGDGTYSLQPDGSTDGYWKLLIDFKMYDNQGNGSPQLPVQPNFNMAEAMRMLEEYKGEHDSFPVAQDVVDDFVKEYRGDKGGVQKVDGRYTLAPIQSSARRNAPDNISSRDYLAESDDSIAETVEERNALTIYQERLKAHAEASDAVFAAEQATFGKEGQELADARAELAKARKHQKDLYNRLLKVENTEHVKKVVERTQRFINEELHGKTKKQLETIVADKEQKILELRAELNGLKEAAKNQRAFDRNETEEIYKERIDKINERNEKKAHEAHVKMVSERVERHNDYEARLHKADVRSRQKIESLKTRDMVRLENTIAKYEREIARLNNKATAMFLENNMKYLNRIADIRERRDLNLEIRKKERHLKGTVKALSDLILRETDYKNVKDPIKPAVHALVKAFVDDFGNLVFYNPSDEAVAGGKTSALEAREKFERLKMTYDKLANIDGEEAMVYDPEVSAWLAELHTLAESYDTLATISESKTRLKTKLYIYERLSGIADSIAFMVKTADQIFVNGRRQQIANVAGDVADTLSEKADKKEFTGKLGEAVNVLDDSLLKGNMTAVTFFESLGNSGLKYLYDDITEAERVSAARVKDARDFIADLMKKHGYLSWNNMRKPVSFVTEQGREVYMTTGNMLWAYAVAKRELSNPLTATHHLSEGGFAYDEKTKRTKEVNNSQWKNDHNKLSAKDIVTIEHMLTEDQKAFADACIEYLSTECADWGNEASLALFGIKKYNEEYYFPFQVDGDQLYKNSAAGSASTTDDARLKHLSFTHRVTSNANKPLIMGDFLDIVDNHINQMAIYSAFVLPIENLNRVLNSKVEYNDEEVTIRSLIARKHGKAAQKYLNDFLKDMNGGPQTDKRGEMNAFIRLFKKNAVMGKLQVALQQFSSIARAFVYINPKYFMNIPKELPYTTWERMMQYSGTTVYKDMGGFNIGLGKQAADWIGKGALEEHNYWERGKFLLDQKGVAAMKDNWVDFLTALPGVVDKMTWAMIWTATENEQADIHPGMDRNSVEFLEMVGERFDDIVRHSQVYDSVLAKSQNMRSKSGLAKMITAFMAEPTLTMNMLYSAVRSKDKKVIARTVSSLVLNAVLGALGYAAIAAWDKDDDERTATEKFVTKFSGKLADSINPLTMIPFVSDFWSLISGYDVERTDMAVFADLYKYGANFIGKLSEGKEITFRDYENFLGTAVLTATGVPIKNLMGDFRKLVLNLPGTDFSAPPASRVKYGVLDEVVFGRDASNTAYYERLLAATMDGDKQEMYDLKDYLMATKGVKEDTVRNGVVNAYKKEYQRGGITKKEATDFLYNNDLVNGATADKKRQAAFKKVDEWDEGSEDYSVYNTIFDAVKNGNSAGITNGIKELTNNGYVESDVVSGVRTLIRESYMEGTMSQSQVKAAYKSRFAPKNFDVNDQNDWYWLFKELDWGKKNGNSTDGYSNYIFLKDGFTKYNESTIRNAWNELTSHGYEDDDVKSYVRTYILKPMVQEGKITTSRATELLNRWASYKKNSDNIDKPQEWLNSK